MLHGSVRVVTLMAVFAVASHAGFIGASGTDCGGDPPITNTVFTIHMDSQGNFCDAFTNGLPGPAGGTEGGTTITSLTFQSDLSAGTSVDDYTCTSDIFAHCDVSVNNDLNLLTIFLFNNPFIGNLDVRGPLGIPPGATFSLNFSDFTANQSIEVDVNGGAPEPGSMWLLVSAVPFYLWKRRKRA